MAVNNPEAPTSELQEIRNLLWGPNIKEDVFRRWAQGINIKSIFSIYLLLFIYYFICHFI